MTNKNEVFKQGYHKLLLLLEHRWQESKSSDINQFVEQGMRAYRFASDITEQQLNEIETQLRVDLNAFVESVKFNPPHYRETPELLAMQGTLWQWLWQISDNSQVEWQGVADDIEHDGIYRANEVVGLGRFECGKCHHQMFYYHPDILPSCPECDGAEFKRVAL